VPTSEQNASPDELCRLLVEGVADYAMILLDADGRILHWNTGAASIFGYAPEEALGQSLEMIFVPEDRAARVPEREMGTAAAQGRAQDLRWHAKKDGARFWADGILTRLPGEEGGTPRFAKVLRDATEQKQVEESIAERTRIAALISDVGIALTTRHTLAEMLHGCAEALVTHLHAAFARIWTLNVAEDVLELQASAGQYTHLDGPHGRVPVGKFKIGLIAQERRPHLTNDVLGDPRVSDQEWAQREGMVAFAGYPLILQDRLVGVAALFARQPLSPVTLQGLGSVASQIAVGIDRRRTEEALYESAERLRAALAASGMGTFRWDIRSNALEWDENLDRLFGLPPGQTVRSLENFIACVHPDDREEVIAKCRQCAEAGADFDFAFRVIRPDGSLCWLDDKGRTFRDAEGRPFYMTGACMDITPQKQAAEEMRTRVVREALLNRVNDAIRATTDPDQIQITVAALLGEALEADRCYFSVYDRAADAVRIARDWRRPGLPSVAGEYRLSEYQGYVDELYAQGTAIIKDARSETVPPTVRRVLAGFGIRAFLAVPLLDGGRFMAAVSASMSDGPRAWTTAEIALMEAALTQTRMAVEAARVAARERNISRQLQAALQPDLPGAVPGLALTKHYKAALAEAGVGGDFYDVFALEKGRTALVVGDLSGKGLAAASQVATVRNMLRAFLYTRSSLADAADALNWVLAEHGLLTGFATLFVGIYDSATGTLDYVNMGQEPALLRRADTGAVEQLNPTGPILGAIERARFAARTVALKPGDALAVFTDGVTEVGESRRAMLGIEGVSALFAASVPAHESEGFQAQAEERTALLAQRLVAGVEAAAIGGVMRDDICLLVAVAE
jgi:PAS domain S-box-containing protein